MEIEAIFFNVDVIISDIDIYLLKEATHCTALCTDVPNNSKIMFFFFNSVVGIYRLDKIEPPFRPIFGSPCISDIYRLD